MRNFISSRKKSFEYAFSGISYVLRTQKNAWIHLTITCLVCAAAFVFRFSVIEWAVLLLCLALVWVTEFLNTAIESAVDLVQPDAHPIAKVSKDVAAAAVLIAAVCAVLVGLVLFVPKLYMLLF